MLSCQTPFQSPHNNVAWGSLLMGKSAELSRDPKESPLAYPFSFPRPDASCFIANYAPNEPTILLPNNFLVANDLDSIVSSLEAYLSENIGRNVAFTSTGSSWSGTCASEYSSCTFRVCVYKSKKSPGQHVVEVQRTGGDGFVFGDFYNNLKTALRW